MYAYPTVPDGKLHVLAAWLPPGHTRFTPDGPLPSDHDGVPFALAGLLVAVSIIVVWSRRRLRQRALRTFARTTPYFRRRARTFKRAAYLVFAVGLVGEGAHARRAPVRALQVGSGLRGETTVEARKVGDQWQRCSYDRVSGEYRCDHLVTVLDTTWAIVNDEQSSWPFTTPAIYVRPGASRNMEVKITMYRHVSGRYLAGADGRSAEIAIAGEPTVVLDKQQIVDIKDDGDREVVISATIAGSPLWLTFVREDTVVPARDYPEPPATPR